MSAGATDDLSKITAVILAGGMGTRLQPVLADRPKALAEVHGRPFLAYLLDSLAAAGLNYIVLCTGHFGDQLREMFGKRYRSLQLAYSQEPAPLGTGGALRRAQALFQSDPVLVINGDSFCDVSLAGFWEWHRVRDSKATLLVVQVPDVRRYGSVSVDAKGAISRFKEKGGEGHGLISAGTYLISRRLVEEIPQGRVVSLEQEVFPRWVGRGLFAYQGDGHFLDIGTPEDYRKAESFFRQRAPVKLRRFVVLDRDGTINEECTYLSDPAQVNLVPGAAEALRELKRIGLGLVVVTNQSAVARGLFDEARLERIHRRLIELLEAEGVHLDGIYFCPHKPEDRCLCRKPLPALVQKAAIDLGFDPQVSFVIGDKPCDIDLGRNIGATTLLVRTGYGAQFAADKATRADYVAKDLGEAALVVKRLLTEEARSVTDDH